jgi:hypothetical protein
MTEPTPPLSTRAFEALIIGVASALGAAFGNWLADRTLPKKKADKEKKP